MSLFSNAEIQSDIVLRKGGKIPSCISCKLYKSGCQSPKMIPSGKGGKKILIVLDMPNAEEDIANKYMRGKGGMLLRGLLKDYDIDVFEDCVITSAVRCRPMENEEGNPVLPDAFQVDSCRTFLLKEINRLRPKLIIAMGTAALLGVIGNIWQDDLDKIEKWRGWIIPEQTLKCFVAPMYSATNVVDNKNLVLRTLLKQDLFAAIKALKEPFPVWKEPNIKIIKSLAPLREIKPTTINAFDYETTGLKPHAPGHRIVTASIATTPDDVWAFRMPTTEEKREPFIAFLLHKYIYKIAHNMKYEENWSFNILGVRVKGWLNDTMQMAHIFDNRRGITSLKFQGYIMFGLRNYSIEVDQYLKGVDPDNANSMNRVLEYMRSERNLEHLLIYNAIDSIVEYRLYNLQQELMKHIIPF